MSFLGELLSYAREEEARLAKLEAEKQLMPLWLVSYAIARYKGEEFMEFKDFIAEAFKDDKEPAKPKKQKTPEEILAEFGPMIEADRLKGG